MNTINVKVGTDTDSINLGRRGENEATEVVFDVSSLISTYGAGTPVLLAKRAKDSTAYPVSATSEEDSVTWLVNSADTAYKGSGECELYWYVGDVLAKTVVWSTWVSDDIGEEDEAPEPQQGWVTQMLEQMQTIADSAQASADSASESADSAQASAEEAQTILNSTIYIGADGNFYIRS